MYNLTPKNSVPLAGSIVVVLAFALSRFNIEVPQNVLIEAVVIIGYLLGLFTNASSKKQDE